MTRETGVWTVDAINAIDPARADFPRVLRYINFPEVFNDVEHLYNSAGWKWYTRWEAQCYLDDGDAEQAWECVMTAVERYQEEFC